MTSGACHGDLYSRYSVVYARQTTRPAGRADHPDRDNSVRNGFPRTSRDSGPDGDVANSAA